MAGVGAAEHGVAVEPAGAPRSSSVAALALAGGSFALAAAAAVTGLDSLVAGALALLLVAPLAFVRTIPWRVLLGALILVIVFIPIRRYTFPTGLPIQLEPYRVAVALLLGCWLGSLLVDEKTRLRRTGFEGVMLALLGVAVASVLANGSRAAPLQTEVIKALSFLASFLLVFFFVTTLMRSRRDVDSTSRTLVLGMIVVGALAVVESRTGITPFSHLDRFLPLLLESGELERGSGTRAFGPAEHPIALGAALVLMVPIALHYARTAQSYRPLWWAGVAVLTMGSLATLSRTGVVMLVVVGLVFLWLRTRETMQLWPLLLPFLAVVHFAAPGTLGSVKASFFPDGGLIEEQNTVVGSCTSSGRLADIGPTLQEVSRQPLLGIGYGTRIPSGEKQNGCILDNQWLGTLLDTGVLGLLAWLAVFVTFIRRLGRAAARAGPDGDLCVALAAAIAAYAVSMLTYDALSFIQVTFILFLLMALAASTLARVHDAGAFRAADTPREA